MWTSTYLKFHPNTVVFWFSCRFVNISTLKNFSTLYWKCLETITGLLFNIKHLSWYLKFDILQFALFNFWIISAYSFLLRSTEDKVRKKAGTPNCFTIVSTADWNFLLYTRSNLNGIHKCICLIIFEILI